MSELQIIILIVGIGVVVLVYLFNVYQEWRFRQKTRQAFSSHDDVLLKVPKNNVRDGVLHDRMEPSLITPAEPEPDSHSIDHEKHFQDHHPYEVETPTVTDTASTRETSPEESAQPSALVMNPSDHQALVAALLDPSLDFIVEVGFREPCQLVAIPQFKANKRIQLIGRTEKGLWTPVELFSGVRYQQVNVSIQMVDRGGAITEQELNAFCEQVSQFADHYDGMLVFPQRQQRLRAANELDRFCNDVDVLVGVNIRATEKPVEGTRLRSFVEAAGMQLEPDGAFHYLAESGNTLFSLVSDEKSPFTYHTLLDNSFTTLSLLFDVPRVAGGIEVFERMIHFARRLTAEFQAELVDDNYRLLTDHGIEQIKAQLVRIYNEMDDHGIAPGSVAALRLFA